MNKNSYILMARYTYNPSTGKLTDRDTKKSVDVSKSGGNLSKAIKEIQKKSSPSSSGSSKPTTKYVVVTDQGKRYPTNDITFVPDGVKNYEVVDTSTGRNVPKSQQVKRVEQGDQIYNVTSTGFEALGKTKGETAVQARQIIKEKQSTGRQVTAGDALRASTGYRGQPVPLTPQTTQVIKSNIDKINRERTQDKVNKINQAEVSRGQQALINASSVYQKQSRDTTPKKKSLAYRTGEVIVKDYAVPIARGTGTGFTKSLNTVRELGRPSKAFTEYNIFNNLALAREYSSQEYREQQEKILGMSLSKGKQLKQTPLQVQASQSKFTPEERGAAIFGLVSFGSFGLPFVSPSVASVAGKAFVGASAVSLGYNLPKAIIQDDPQAGAKAVFAGTALLVKGASDFKRSKQFVPIDNRNIISDISVKGNVEPYVIQSQGGLFPQGQSIPSPNKPTLTYSFIEKKGVFSPTKLTEITLTSSNKIIEASRIWGIRGTKVFNNVGTIKNVPTQLLKVEKLGDYEFDKTLTSAQKIDVSKTTYQLNQGKFEGMLTSTVRSDLTLVTTPTQTKGYDAFASSKESLKIQSLLPNSKLLDITRSSKLIGYGSQLRLKGTEPTKLVFGDGGLQERLVTIRADTGVGKTIIKVGDVFSERKIGIKFEGALINPAPKEYVPQKTLFAGKRATSAIVSDLRFRQTFKDPSIDLPANINTPSVSPTSLKLFTPTTSALLPLTSSFSLLSLKSFSNVSLDKKSRLSPINDFSFVRIPSNKRKTEDKLDNNLIFAPFVKQPVITIPKSIQKTQDKLKLDIKQDAITKRIITPKQIQIPKAPSQFININPIIDIIPPPPFMDINIPLFGKGTEKKKKKRSPLDLSGRYTPTVFSAFLNVRSNKKDDLYKTGLTLRPILNVR